GAHQGAEAEPPTTARPSRPQPAPNPRAERETSRAFVRRAFLVCVSLRPHSSYVSDLVSHQRLVRRAFLVVLYSHQSDDVPLMFLALSFSSAPRTSRSSSSRLTLAVAVTRSLNRPSLRLCGSGRPSRSALRFSFIW